MSNWTVTVRRKNEMKPTHHLWLNRNIWWLVISLYNKETRKTMRHRQSLRTEDQAVAIKRRDKVLQALYAAYGKKEK